MTEKRSDTAEIHANYSTSDGKGIQIEIDTATKRVFVRGAKISPVPLFDKKEAPDRSRF